MIKGMAVILYDKTQTGTDEIGKPIYSESPVNVENVLIGEPSTTEMLETNNLTGKILAYTLGIPKGDSHVWTDRTIEFFGKKFHTIGEPTQGIESNIPLAWNLKVKVERYD